MKEDLIGFHPHSPPSPIDHLSEAVWRSEEDEMKGEGEVLGRDEVVGRGEVAERGEVVGRGVDGGSWVEIPVPHVQQEHSWDCGLACLKMALRWCLPGGSTSEETFDNLCLELDFRHSVWTIDLAYILQRLNIKHLFCTVTLGVNRGYQKEHYYKNVLNHDELRVNLLFRRASENHVRVEKRCVELEEIIEHLSQGNILIVLVNSRYITCAHCDGNKCLECMLTMCMPHGYYGHFILVCGYDLSSKSLLYRNPTCKDKVCCLSYDRFEEARHSYGTDDDILFIYAGERL